MEPLRVYQIDAFTTRRYQGNPAGVVANATGLNDRQMQLIARELNNSETAFILPAEGPDHDLRIRFFTSTTEVPVCGHATLSAHYVLALEGGGTGLRRQLTGAGVQRVETTAEDGDYRIAIEQNPPTFRSPLPSSLVGAVATALNLGTDDLDPRCPLQFVSTGHGKLLVGVRERSTLQALQPDATRLLELGARIGSRGFFAFTLDTPDDDEAHTWGRMFAPAIGIGEDPVTGNANGPLGAYLVKHGLIEARGESVRYRARQTAGNGRTGWMDVVVRVDAGAPVGVRIEGRAVQCFRTTLLHE